MAVRAGYRHEPVRTVEPDDVHARVVDCADLARLVSVHRGHTTPTDGGVKREDGALYRAVCGGGVCGHGYSVRLQPRLAQRSTGFLDSSAARDMVALRSGI